MDWGGEASFFSPILLLPQRFILLDYLPFPIDGKSSLAGP